MISPSPPALLALAITFSIATHLAHAFAVLPTPNAIVKLAVDEDGKNQRSLIVEVPVDGSGHRSEVAVVTPGTQVMVRLDLSDDENDRDMWMYEGSFDPWQVLDWEKTLHEDRNGTIPAADVFVFNAKHVGLVKDMHFTRYTDFWSKPKTESEASVTIKVSEEPNYILTPGINDHHMVGDWMVCSDFNGHFDVHEKLSYDQLVPGDKLRMHFNGTSDKPIRGGQVDVRLWDVSEKAKLVSQVVSDVCDIANICDAEAGEEVEVRIAVDWDRDMPPSQYVVQVWANDSDNEGLFCGEIPMAYLTFSRHLHQHGGGQIGLRM